MEDNPSINGRQGWGMVWGGDVSGSNESDGGAGNGEQLGVADEPH